MHQVQRAILQVEEEEITPQNESKMKAGVSGLYLFKKLNSRRTCLDSEISLYLFLFPKDKKFTNDL